MCVDYTGLNKVCPNDPFSLPRIDQIVDSTSGCETLCFLDAYSGYHQITMKESDQLVTSFITPFGSFCYVSILFGLKNTRAACSNASGTSSGGPLRPTLMTSWSSPNRLTTSLSILSRPLQNFEQMASNSILRSVFLGSQGVCCSASSSLSAASKPT